MSADPQPAPSDMPPETASGSPPLDSTSVAPANAGGRAPASAEPATSPAAGAPAPPGKGLLQFKVVVPALFALAALAAAFVYRHQRLSGLPDPGDPFAHAAADPAVPEEENAYRDYAAAANLLVEPDPLVRIALEDAPRGEAATPKVAEWAAANRPALDAWKAGAGKPWFFIDDRPPVDRLSGDPLFEQLHDLARAACIEGTRLASAGRFDEAWAWFRAAFRCSRHCGQRGLLAERMTGARMHALAARAIHHWAADPGVDAGMLERALADLREDDRLTPTVETLLRNEYLAAVRLLEDPERATGSSNVHGLGRIPLYFMNEPEYSRRVVGHVFDNWRGELDRPPAERRRVESTIPRLYAPPGDRPDAPSADRLLEWLAGSVLTLDVLPSLGTVDDALLNERARQGMLLTALAAQRAYRLESRFPDRAEDLLQGAFEKLPFDPYGSNGATIRYRRVEDGAVAWSVGPDGRNDGDDAETVGGTSRGLRVKIAPPVRP